MSETAIFEENFKEVRQELDKIKQKTFEKLNEVTDKLTQYYSIDEKLEKLKDSRDQITLNIGGQEFRVGLNILLNQKYSLFYCIIYASIKDNKSFNEIFIDRNYSIFDYVLEVMQKGYSSLSLDTNNDFSNMLIKELEFYGLELSHFTLSYDKRMNQFGDLKHMIFEPINKMYINNENNPININLSSLKLNSAYFKKGETVYFELKSAIRISQVLIRSAFYEPTEIAKNPKTNLKFEAVKENGDVELLGNISKDFKTKEIIKINCNNKYLRKFQIKATDDFGLSFVGFTKQT